MNQAPFVPVIPAGGSGTRLWPLSRPERPKFLLDLTGSGRSLLQQTLDRLAPIAEAPPLVVTGAAHAAAVRDQLEGTGARVLVEPSPRNSMPAIALAAAVAEREHPGAVIGSFAADHRVADVPALHAAIAAARAAAAQGYLVTLGIRPTAPATGFGYIERADGADRADRAEGTDDAVGEQAPGDLAGTGAEPVAAFVEKPDRARAEEFLAGGRHLWNAGMFVVRAAVLLEELAAELPPLAAGAREIAAALGTEHEEEAVARLWPTLTRIAIDHALAEPLAARGRVAVVPVDLGWDDVGDFRALARQLRAPGAGPAVRTVEGRAGDAEAVDVRVLGAGPVDALDARATVYGSTHRRIALVGVDGISVVDTEDVLLVIADERAQDLAALVAALPPAPR